MEGSLLEPHVTVAAASLQPWRPGGPEARGPSRVFPTCSLYKDLPAKSSQLSLSQNDVRWQAYSDAKYYADDGVRDSCQWPQVTRHDKVPDRQVEG